MPRSDDKRPVLHLVKDVRGGIANYANQLILSLQTNSSHRQIFYGPRDASLPASIPQWNFKGSEHIWGLRQWQFAMKSAYPIDRKAICHTHNFSIRPSDIHTVHGFYSRNWLAKHPSQIPVSFQARLQFKMLSQLERRMIENSSRVVFVSSENKDYAEQEMHLKPRTEWQIIGPGVDADRYHPLPINKRQDLRRQHFPDLNPDLRWIVFAGNDFYGKGLLSLLDTFEKQKESPQKSSPNLELLVFGEDARHKTAAYDLASKQGLRCTFFGHSSSLREGLQASDILFMYSVSEGFPLVLLEAMACGCVPCVNQFGGVSDVIVHRQNGFVGKGISELAEALGQISEPERIAWSSQAIKTALQHTWTRVAQSYEALYDQL